MDDQLNADDNQLRYIETLRYLDRAIKIARRGDVIKLLIYAPGEMLASEILEAPLTDYEDALMRAKARIDQAL